jgi:hypothetical protein
MISCQNLPIPAIVHKAQNLPDFLLSETNSNIITFVLVVRHRNALDGIKIAKPINSKLALEK